MTHPIEATILTPAHPRGAFPASTQIGDTALSISLEHVRQVFQVDEHVVSALPPDVDYSVTSQERVKAWRRLMDRELRRAHELLIPRIVRPVERQWPAPWMVQKGHLDLTAEQIDEAIDSFGRWNVPFALGDGRMTRKDKYGEEAVDRWSYRVEHFNGAIAGILGSELADTTFLDIASGPGYFTLDMASRGAKWVDGMDLREQNVEQARFMAEHYGIDNVAFEIGDVDEFDPDRQWDVVLSYGLLYHLVDPIGHIKQLHDLCTRFAVIDTECARDAVSGYLLLSDKDNSRTVEGRENYEFHPTYRGLIDTIRLAGFSDMIELVGIADPPHPAYDSGTRRVIIAIK